MSTRCNVQIKSEGLPWNDVPLVLYRHCDGYPSSIVPALKEAFKLAIVENRLTGKMPYEAGRTGKAASFICASAPGQFEPEAEQVFHVDIKYLYLLTLVNKEGGIMADKPRWELEVRQPTSLFWDDPRIENAKVITSRKPLSKFTAKQLDD